VLDIYAASEQPIEGVTGEALAARVREASGKLVAYAGSMEEAVARLAADARDGDVVMTMGAGTVSAAGGMWLERLRG